MRKELKIGIFAVIIIIGSYFMITFLKGKDIFNRQNRIYAVFENVEGLSPAAAVNLQGMKIGLVETIDYDQNDQKVLVTMLVASRYDIGTDAVAELYSSDLLGGKAIRINLGQGDTLIEEGDTLRSAVSPDMISSLVGSITPIAEEIKVLAANLNTTVNSINEVLDEDTRAQVSTAIDNFSKAMINLNGISADVRESMPEIQAIISHLEVLSASVSESGEEISKVVKNAEEFTRQLSETDIKNTVEELKSLIASLQDKNGTVGKLLYDDSIHNDIDAILKNVNELITKISENPKKYLKISAF